VVIDFEYAAPNVPGQEFANHFTEWAYNYHDAIAPYACRAELYPPPDVQRRFIKAYVEHRPKFPHRGSTPRMSPLDTPTGGVTPAFGAASSSSSIVDFMLDARVPSGQWTESERQREEQTDKVVTELIEETRLWRPANSAMWVAWGIVQAKLPGGDDGEAESDKSEGEGEEDEEFDYLRYTQDRALFFWGDCVRMGFIKAEDLPEDIRGRIKVVDR
jgi:choline kinase